MVVLVPTVHVYCLVGVRSLRLIVYWKGLPLVQLHPLRPVSEPHPPLSKCRTSPMSKMTVLGIVKGQLLYADITTGSQVPS